MSFISVFFLSSSQFFLLFFLHFNLFFFLFAFIYFFLFFSLSFLLFLSILYLLLIIIILYFPRPITLPFLPYRILFVFFRSPLDFAVILLDLSFFLCGISLSPFFFFIFFLLFFLFLLIKVYLQKQV